MRHELVRGVDRTSAHMAGIPQACSAAVRDDDALLLSGERVLNRVFERIVRRLHSAGGVFEGAMSPATLESGLLKLSVGSMLVKELGLFFGCGGGRARLRAWRAWRP